MKDKRFFYKAQRADNKEWIEGRVGTPQYTEDGIEKTSYFYEYTGDESTYSEWATRTVITDSIVPLN